MKFRILELFSGIGGMHTAFQYSRLPGHVVRAFDINTVANEVYAHNHPDTPVLPRNIQKLQAKELEKLDVNMLLMSPPCQPHTRMGNKWDVSDKRSEALNHLCGLLPQCPSIRYVLLENVVGFERSKARDMYIEALNGANFFWREFILSPEQFGLCNHRPRYYCLARRGKDFAFSGKDPVLTGANQLYRLPKEVITSETPSRLVALGELLEAPENIPQEVMVPDKMLLRHFWLMDIFTSDTTDPTDCFTKGYTHFAHGTGSVYTPLSDEESQPIFAALNETHEEEPRLKLLKDLRMRYFTPREVARLMSFPETFQFPEKTTTRQKYRLLGNSVNVVVVGELLKVLVGGEDDATTGTPADAASETKADAEGPCCSSSASLANEAK